MLQGLLGLEIVTEILKNTLLLKNREEVSTPRTGKKKKMIQEEM